MHLVGGERTGARDEVGRLLAVEVRRPLGGEGLGEELDGGQVRRPLRQVAHGRDGHRVVQGGRERGVHGHEGVDGPGGEGREGVAGVRRHDEVGRRAPVPGHDRRRVGGGLEHGRGIAERPCEREVVDGRHRDRGERGLGVGGHAEEHTGG